LDEGKSIPSFDLDSSAFDRDIERKIDAGRRSRLGSDDRRLRPEVDRASVKILPVQEMESHADALSRVNARKGEREREGERKHRFGWTSWLAIGMLADAVMGFIPRPDLASRERISRRSTSMAGTSAKGRMHRGYSQTTTTGVG